MENLLLNALPKVDSEALRTRLERVALDEMQVLFEADGPVSHVYFPCGSIISMTLTVAEGTVEVGMIGNEGMAGLPLFFGAERSPCVATCQLAGDAMRVEAGAFQAFVRESPALHRLLHRYAAYMQVQSLYSTACNRLHSAEQRLCRWLLMTHNRAGADEFLLKQEFLARMLGVRRPTVSIIANAVQKAGLIRYRRGRMTILDRPALEAAACECYAAVRNELERLLLSAAPD